MEEEVSLMLAASGLSFVMPLLHYCIDDSTSGLLELCAYAEVVAR